MNTLAEQWESYRRVVVPKDAPPVQVRETRRAFYAGATALFGVLMTALTTGDVAQPEDVDLLKYIQGEINDYVAETVSQAFADAARRGR